MDLLTDLGFGADMDNDTRELIIQLCTQIGMIMEDGSVIALGVPGLSEPGWKASLSEISDMASKIAALSAATEALAH